MPQKKSGKSASKKKSGENIYSQLEKYICKKAGKKCIKKKSGKKYNLLCGVVIKRSSPRRDSQLKNNQVLKI